MNRKLQTNLLIALTVVSLGIAGIATVKAYSYRDTYIHNPQVKVESHNSVITKYTDFNQDRTQAYACKTQPIDASGFGMVCSSPDGATTINCTAVASNPTEYFC
jgi:hypothetical protein